MRFFEFKQSIADELVDILAKMGYSAEKKTKNKVKIVVPSKERFATAEKLSAAIPGSSVSDDRKSVTYNGGVILVKPSEAQGGRLDKEEAQRNEIDGLIKDALNGQPTISLQVGNRLVQAAGAVQAKPGVKADIAIVDATGNPTAWVSLKDGSKAKDFGQWGGITHKPVWSHPEVQEFVNTLKQQFGSEFPRGSSYGRPIQDSVLKLQSVYGKFYGREPGESNVDIVLQGKPTLVKGKEGQFILKGQVNFLNGQVPDGDYDPAFIVRYIRDRGNAGIQFARISVYPTKGRPWKPI